MKTVAIIPARGGSKGLAGKNLHPFCGRPLLHWTVTQALQSGAVDAVYVSTDHDRIASEAASSGARVIRRPAELAKDSSPSEEALVHALDEIETSEDPVELIVFLQVTSPLREPEDIQAAIRLLEETGSDSLVSVSSIDLMLWRHGPNGEALPIGHEPGARKRRQDLEVSYHDNGSIYLTRPQILREVGNRLGGKIALFELLPRWKMWEIDVLDDARLCESLARQYLFDQFRAPRIRIGDLDGIVYDFDGVLTDNRVLTLQDGTEGILANRSDGLAISRLRALGVRQIVISTETNPVVGARSRKLGLDVIQGVGDKGQTVTEWAQEAGLDPQRLLFIGNDLNDLPAMEVVGHTACPADSHPQVLHVAGIVLESRGGEGVVRELVDRVLDFEGGPN